MKTNVGKPFRKLATLLRASLAQNHQSDNLALDETPEEGFPFSMPINHHPLTEEFPNDHDTIHKLKLENAHFRKLMEEYEALDKEIFRMEEGIENPEDAVLTEEKKRRLDLKDQIATMIQEAS